MNEDALEALKRVLVSHEEPPIGDMERLIGLAAGDPVLTRELVEGSAEVLSADPASLVPCWLALLVGELGPSSADLLLSTLGTSEGDAMDAAILSVLTRHVGLFYGAITAALDEAAPEERDVRAFLYAVLLAAAVGPDQRLRDELRLFASRRETVEAQLGADRGDPAAAAQLLAVASGKSDVGGPLANTTPLLDEDWRGAARRISSLFAAAH
jgi:hypothetical protein